MSNNNEAAAQELGGGDGAAQVANKGNNQVLTVHGIRHPIRSLTQNQIDEWKRACLARLPSANEYQVIYADPPWQYNRMGRSLEGLTPYPTMPHDELCALPVAKLAATTSVLFLWVTNPLLEKGLEVMRAWGFEYKTVYKVWCKRWANGAMVAGVGWWSRPSTELVLVGTRGTGYMKWKQTHSEPQEFVGPKRRHSEKPDEIRESIRGFFDDDDAGGLRRIELFARTKGPGFDAWGLEIPGFFQSD